MNTTIQNRQSRINNIIKNFDFKTVKKVIKALNQQDLFDVQPGETLKGAIIRNSVGLINNACDMYEQMNEEGMLVSEMAGLQVTIQSRSNTEHKVSLSYVVDTMETYNW